MLPAGQLRERVTFEMLVEGQDELGQPLNEWETYDEDVPARVTPIRGRERAAAGGVVTESLIEVVVRYRQDITAAMRLIWRGVPYAIQGQPIDINARREGLEIMASAGAPAGSPE